MTLIAIFWYLIMWIIGVFILYIIIKLAINNSEATHLLREIRDILKKQDIYNNSNRK